MINFRQKIHFGIRPVAVAMAGTMVLSGCAQRAGSIAPAAIPESAYSNMNCQQLNRELESERTNLNALAKKQNVAATADAIAVFITLIPAASLVGGDRSGDLSVSKGKVVSIEAQIKGKGC